MPDVIGIGASLFDTLMMVDYYPAEDTKLRTTHTLLAGGGPCATALAAVARLGVDAAYMGQLGDDTYGDFMIADFKKYRVQTHYIHRAPGQSAHAVVFLSQRDATRTCVWNPGTAPSLQPEQLDREALSRCRILHLDGHHIEAAVAAAQIVHAAGHLVSLDAGAPYPGIERLLPHIDLMIPSEECALKLTGETDPAKAALLLKEKYHPQTLVVTQGKAGGFYLENRAPLRYPVYPVKAVDTNGCGDVFHGAFVAAFIKGMTVPQACRFASATSALKCGVFGARAGIPAWGEVEAFLKEREGA